ncbi:hypothetical protein B9Y64_08440 [Stenotrophomonas maltophilia]|uniref:Uncharacterized protein n=1 Tax=Stenotrophomonas maltophilia TaxID=40324 RepID=A0A2J0UDS0_STEMA|nr:hypothetical protein B9Y64_08440 [Stenotrophomonas maltophilia]
MDAATEPTWMYLRRPPQPDPPRHPTECQLLPLLLLRLLPSPLQVQGCKPCRTPLTPPECCAAPDSGTAAWT